MRLALFCPVLLKDDISDVFQQAHLSIVAGVLAVSCAATALEKKDATDLLAQESQQGGNWFDVIHNDDLWNRNIKDGPAKEMLLSIEKAPHKPLAGPPPNIRPPPNYIPQGNGWANKPQVRKDRRHERLECSDVMKQR